MASAQDSMDQDGARATTPSGVRRPKGYPRGSYRLEMEDCRMRGGQNASGEGYCVRGAGEDLVVKLLRCSFKVRSTT
jgi:hypothetical protein